MNDNIGIGIMTSINLKKRYTACKDKYTKEFLIQHVNNAFNKSDNNESKLTNDILQIDGMSGIKTRHLYNNICSLEGANYLEVGTWKGSSFVSAIYGNKINSIAVDNWSEFNGPKDEFFSNVESLSPGIDYNFIEKDSFKVKKEDFPEKYGKVDIYLYDGCHEYESHKKAITHFQDLLSDICIIIVDDWRTDGVWERVQRGTYDGFRESGLIIHHKLERITQQENNGPSEYWNGVGVFVCEKMK
jgi:hypothetical protein